MGFLQQTKKNFQKGQALLAVVLVMVVSLTVALSIAVKTITNIRTSSEDENSQRAFSAAEAGVEKALLQPDTASITGDFSNNSNYNTTKSLLSGTGILIKNGTTVLKDEPVDVWLSTYPTYASPFNGNVVISWGNSGESCTSSETTNTQSALEIIIISGTTASPTVNQYAYDPCATRISTSNKFSTAATPGETVSGRAFAYKTASISINSGLLMRIVPLYSATPIGIVGSTNLPSQGTIITSVGVSDTSQRKIVSFRGFPKIPIELFPFVLFSPK